MKKTLFFCLLLALLVGCNRPPKPVLKQEAMAHLLVDLELADAYSTDQRLGTFAPDSMRLALRQSVLAKHHVNEATLDTSLRWYGRNLPLLLKVYDRMDSILADSLRVITRQEQLARAEAAGDTARLWPREPSIMLSHSREFISFSLPVDSTWERGDVVQWSVSLHNLRKQSARMTLAVNYADRAATTELLSTLLNPRDGNRLQVTIQLDRQKSAREITGYIHIPIDSGLKVYADSITLIRTRDVAEEYGNRRYRLHNVRRHKPL